MRVSAVLFIIMLAFGVSDIANGQGSEPSHPFSSLEIAPNVQTNPEQSRRLKLIRDLPTTESVHVFRVHKNAHIGDEVMIPIPDDKSLVLSKTGGETRSSKDFTWFGVVKEGKDRGTATLVVRNGEISGSVTTSQGVYRISPLGDGLYAIAKLETRKLPPDEPAKKNQ